MEPQRADVTQMDAFDLSEKDCDGANYIITNPPWSRDILHPLILRFVSLRPTWLLFDADWLYTKQAKAYMPVLRGGGGGGSREMDRGFHQHRQRQLCLVFIQQK
jgi:hypothetical protein